MCVEDMHLKGVLKSIRFQVEEGSDGGGGGEMRYLPHWLKANR
jgi:hypothetical protein